jgi:hypothetical protein
MVQRGVRCWHVEDKSHARATILGGAIVRLVIYATFAERYRRKRAV